MGWFPEAKALNRRQVHFAQEKVEYHWTICQIASAPNDFETDYFEIQRS